MSKSNETIDVIMPVLQNIQGDIAILKESILRIDSRISSIENIQAGFHSTLNWHSQELDEHRGRLEALEGQKPDQ